MTDPIAQAESASVSGAEHVVSVGVAALDAVALAHLGPAAPWVIALLQEAETKIDALIAKELPEIEQRIVNDIKTGFVTLGQKVAALFYHASIPCTPGGPVDCMTPAELRAALNAIQPGAPADALVSLSVGNTWSMKALRENAAAISWKAHVLGIT